LRFSKVLAAALLPKTLVMLGKCRKAGSPEASGRAAARKFCQAAV